MHVTCTATSVSRRLNILSMKFKIRSFCMTSVVYVRTFYAPQKPAALRRPHIWADPAHFPYRGITPPPGTDVANNLKSIYGHDDPLVAV